MQDAIIVDIDGTLALKGERSPYDWSRVGEDKVNEPIHNLLWRFAHGYKDWGDEINFILVSGRDEICRPQTKRWIKENKIVCDALFMRPQGNTEKDTIIKERIYREHIEGKYNVLFVLDDRDQVVKMWRSLGLTCLQVAEGNF